MYSNHKAETRADETLKLLSNIIDKTVKSDLALGNIKLDVTNGRINSTNLGFVGVYPL